VSPPYHYFDVGPTHADQALFLEDALERIRMAFPQRELDEDAALEHAKRRHECLLALNSPKELLDLYTNPHVIRAFVTEDWCASYFIEFDLWDKQGIHR
jgi:hypothetical protein